MKKYTTLRFSNDIEKKKRTEKSSSQYDGASSIAHQRDTTESTINNVDRDIGYGSDRDFEAT